jgi:hypothetical protein
MTMTKNAMIYRQISLHGFFEISIITQLAKLIEASSQRASKNEKDNELERNLLSHTLHLPKLLWILTKGTLEDYYAPKHHNPTSSNTQKGLLKLLRAQ